MWFVLATETPEGIGACADAIERETGVQVLRFPKLQEFFIGFRVALVPPPAANIRRVSDAGR